MRFSTYISKVRTPNKDLISKINMFFGIPEKSIIVIDYVIKKGNDNEINRWVLLVQHKDSKTFYGMCHNNSIIETDNEYLAKRWFTDNKSKEMTIDEIQILHK